MSDTGTIGSTNPRDASGSREPHLSDQAKAVGRDLKDKASVLSESVAQTAKDQIGKFGTAAKDIAADAQGKVETALNRQKDVGADYIGNIASAAQRAAEEFEGETPQAAQYIRQAANRMHTVADAVRVRDVRELVGEVEQFARREPTIFFGGALFLGFAAIRFLKTSQPVRQTTSATN